MGLRKVLLIKYTNCTEISFAYDINTIQVIRKCGATFSKSSKKWFITSHLVGEMIKELNKTVDIIVDELGFEKKTPFFTFDNQKFQSKQRMIQPNITEDNKAKYSNDLNKQPSGYDELDTKENKPLQISSRDGEVRVKLNIARDIYADMMLLGCTRDFKRHELVFKQPNVFYNYCKDSNIKFNQI